MKQPVLLLAAVSFFCFTAEDASAQRLLGRIFGVRPAVSQPYASNAAIASQSYWPSASYRSHERVPQPISGYGSNLHRNYMIRRAQKQAAITGIPPRDTANIRWAR